MANNQRVCIYTSHDRDRVCVWLKLSLFMAALDSRWTCDGKTECTAATDDSCNWRPTASTHAITCLRHVQRNQSRVQNTTFVQNIINLFKYSVHRSSWAHLSIMPSGGKEPLTLTHLYIHRVENLHVACWREGDLFSFLYGRLCCPPKYANSQMAARNKTKNYVSTKKKNGKKRN